MDTANPSWDEFLDTAEDGEAKFEDVLSDVEWDHSGVWFSELFFFIVACEIVECEYVIESGRACGISTEVLSRYFDDTDVGFASFETRTDSTEEQKAITRTRDIESANLVYGDSREIVPAVDRENVCVLIDGPKSHDAIKMGMELLADDKFPMVALHDLYQGRLVRGFTETLFNYRLYSDHDRWTSRYKELDEEIWYWGDGNPASGEFGRYGKKYVDGEGYHGFPFTGYGGTIGVFFDGPDPVNNPAKERYLDLVETDPLPSYLGEKLRANFDSGPIRRHLSKAVYTGIKPIYDLFS